MSVTVRQRWAQAAGFEEPAASGDVLSPTRPLAAHTTDGRTAREVVFYRLGEKFVDHERSIPEDVRSGAVLHAGHWAPYQGHRLPRPALDDFARGVRRRAGALGPGRAHDKLAGIEEVRRDRGEKGARARAEARGSRGARSRGRCPGSERRAARLRAPCRRRLSPSTPRHWLEEFLRLLEEIQCEPCVYAMGGGGSHAECRGDSLGQRGVKRGGNIVFCVGSVLRGDDAAGPLLAKKLEDFPVEGWTAVDGGQTPENDLGYLRRLAPRRLLLVDAAAMGLEPGAIRRLQAADVATQSLITTPRCPSRTCSASWRPCAKRSCFWACSPRGPSSSIR